MTPREPVGTVRIGQNWAPYKYDQVFLLEDVMVQNGPASPPGWYDSTLTFFMSSHCDSDNLGGNGARGDGSVSWFSNANGNWTKIGGVPNWNLSSFLQQ